MKKLFLLPLIFISSYLIADASVPFLRLDLNAAAQGEGGAGCASYGSISTMSINPASTIHMQNSSFGISYGNSSELNISATQTSALIPVEGAGNFGISYIYSKQQITDAADDGNLADRIDNQMLLNYSFMGGDSIGYGINLKYANSNIYGTEVSFLDADLGMIYLLDENISLGLSLNGIGGRIDYEGYAYGLSGENLDSELLAGINCRLLNDNENTLTASLDTGYIFTFNRGVVLAGVEYIYRSLFVLRVGDSENAEGEDYLSAGLGMNYEIGGVNFKFDYTYSPKASGSGAFGNNQYISITALL
jgi:hypothetical protein